MFSSWKIGRLFGINIYLHSTFLLLPVLVVLSSLGMSVGMKLFLLALTLVVFGCVLLHELGHALMARYYGIRTVDITLYPIGGVARLERLSEKPTEELMIALAGPAVNLALFIALAPAVFSSVLLLPPGTTTAEAPVALGGWATVVSFLTSVWLANGVLLVFNLLPTFPMDGGRVLRALLSYRMGQVRATTVAVYVGRAVTLAALGLLIAFAPTYLTRNPMLLVVMAFIFLAGQQELMMLRRRAAARRAEAVPEPVAPNLGEGGGVAPPPGFTGITVDPRSGVGVHWYDGRPVGTFSAPTE